MTREQFLKPYMLLVIQPWGQRYALQTAEGQTQSEFYYEELKQVNLHIWEAVCQTYAKGKHWPSIDELTLSIRAKAPKNNDPQIQGPPVPDDFVARRLCTEQRAPGESQMEFYDSILGDLLKGGNDEDPDTETVSAFYSKAKAGFPVKCSCGQEHPACLPCSHCDPTRDRRNDTGVERPLSHAIRKSMGW